MKKWALLILLCGLLLAFSACGTASGDTSAVRIDYGESQLYTTEDLDAAIAVIKETFSTWQGCVLYSLSYAGDESAAENLDYCNSLSDGPLYTECLVFESAFRSPLRGGGAWAANREYEWSWYLAREAGGSWQLLTWGYA